MKSPPKSQLQSQSQSHFSALQRRLSGTARRLTTPLGASSYALFSPLHYFSPLHFEPNYAYPLLVWLHSEGHDESQLVRLMPQLSLRNYVAIAPRWQPLETPPSQRFAEVTHDGADALQERIGELIRLANKRFRIHPQRVFLAGFGAGGTMALWIGLMQPENYAGVLAFHSVVASSGPFPRECAPLRTLSAARRLPIFLAAGCDDAEYPNARLLHMSGLAVTQRWYAGGPELSADILSDANGWIMERVTS